MTARGHGHASFVVPYTPMARRKPTYQATPRSTIQRRQHRRQIAVLGLGITIVATIAYALSAAAGLNGSRPPAGASGPAVTTGPFVDRSAGTVAVVGDPAGRASGDSAGPAPAPSGLALGDRGATAIGPPSSGGSAEPEALTGYRWPLHGGRIGSFFQGRDDGLIVIDGQRVHDGLDIATFCGDHVTAAHAGTVLAAGRHFDRQLGYDGALDAFYARIDRHHSLGLLPIVVVIDDGNGYRSLYAHLEGVTVHAGSQVTAGQLIGYEGSTGEASGCHLHFGMIRMDGAWLHVASALVKRDRYPSMVRERIDPLRVLSLDMLWAPRLVPGINPPRLSPGLDHATAR
jgi:murein DD-endopeptidase MepM/ murein hydrolase activator NlpD